MEIFPNFGALVKFFTLTLLIFSRQLVQAQEKAYADCYDVTNCAIVALTSGCSDTNPISSICSCLYWRGREAYGCQDTYSTYESCYRRCSSTETSCLCGCVAPRFKEQETNSTSTSV